MKEFFMQEVLNSIEFNTFLFSLITLGITEVTAILRVNCNFLSISNFFSEGYHYEVQPMNFDILNNRDLLMEIFYPYYNV